MDRDSGICRFQPDVRKFAQVDGPGGTRPVPRFESDRQRRDDLPAHRCVDGAGLQLLHGVLRDTGHAARGPSADDDAVRGGNLPALLDRDAKGPRRMIAPAIRGRADAIARARQRLLGGEFLKQLDRRVAYPTESQNPERGDSLRAYLEDELKPAFSQLDFSTRLIESPTGKNPYLLAEYHESSSAPTVLTYGHGDVVDGMAGEWRDNLDPWRTTTIVKDRGASCL